MNTNKIIIRDVDLSYNVEEILNEFTKMCVVFLIDFFIEYDRMILIKKSWNLIAFIIFLSLFRIIRLSQSAINSMIQFVQIIIGIFKKHIIISCCWSFINDINVKSSHLNYDTKEILSKIRLFIIKHLQ